MFVPRLVLVLRPTGQDESAASMQHMSSAQQFCTWTKYDLSYWTSLPTLQPPRSPRPKMSCAKVTENFITGRDISVIRMPKTEGIARSAADTPPAPADAPCPPPRPLADLTCARAQWTPQPAALPTSPLSPSFAMPPPRPLTMRNAGRAVELVLFSLPLQRSGCAQHGNPAATPVCAHRNSPPFPDLTRRATPARTFMTHASYAATHVDSHLSLVVSRCCPAEGMGGEE